MGLVKPTIERDIQKNISQKIKPKSIEERLKELEDRIERLERTLE